MEAPFEGDRDPEGPVVSYEGWNFNSGNYLFTTDTKSIHVSKFYCPSL